MVTNEKELTKDRRSKKGEKKESTMYPGKNVVWKSSDSPLQIASPVAVKSSAVHTSVLNSQPVRDNEIAP